MDRVFLDANVLFSLSHRADSPLRQLLARPKTHLLVSSYALNEVQRNVRTPEQHERLRLLLADIEVDRSAYAGMTWPGGLQLHPKDRPILLGAIAGGATHLLSGDEHFKGLFGKKIAGVLILRPYVYLQGLDV